MKIKITVIVVCLAIAGFILYSIKYRSVETEKALSEPKSEALVLMGDILNELQVKIEPKAGELRWNDYTRVTTYPAYTFILSYSAADNEKMANTWKTTGKVDDIAVSSRFENALRQRGFKLHAGNTGDATFSSVQGYVKDDVACTISGRITTPPEQVDDTTSRFESYSTVTCGEIEPATESKFRG